MHLVKGSCEKYANLLRPVEGTEGPAAQVWSKQMNPSHLRIKLLLTTHGFGPTSVFQASWVPSLESHGWSLPLNPSLPPVYLLPSLSRKKKTFF